VDDRADNFFRIGADDYAHNLYHAPVAKDGF